MYADNIVGFMKLLGITTKVNTPERVCMDMPITEDLYQPFGYLHGGATIALLESVASRASELNCNLDVEKPFGVDVHVRHRRSAKSGTLHSEATLDSVEDQGERGRKQFWHVVATDDVGDVVSEGTIVTKVVPLERLAKIEARRAAEAKGKLDVASE